MLSFEEQAERLTALYHERALLNKRIYDHERGIEERKRALTPAEGWLAGQAKATVDQRAAARDAAFANDDDLALHSRTVVDLRGQLILLQADIDGAEVERRAAEWRVRERLLECLVRGGVQPNGRGDRVENAFEDAVRQKVDQAVTDAAAEVVAELAAALEPPAVETVEIDF